jgi:D-alanine-D-alanine ligase
LDLDAAADSLRRMRPDAVFNLVESLGGSDLKQHLAPAMVRRVGLPCTGVSAEAMYLTTHKLLAKTRMREAGLPTPDWIEPRRVCEAHHLAESGALRAPYIIKAVGEHASLGLDDAAVYCGDADAVLREVDRRSKKWGRPYFAERYIDGREFNLSILAGPDGPEVLPPAEIDFGEFPAGKPKIVGYEAKWDAGSFEYAHTPRRFDFAPEDAPLLETLRDLARACWRLFELSGYARVDFRVDEWGRPWILEINSNCCLSPDAGFAAALARAEIAPRAAIARNSRPAKRGDV